MREATGDLWVLHPDGREVDAIGVATNLSVRGNGANPMGGGSAGECRALFPGIEFLYGSLLQRGPRERVHVLVDGGRRDGLRRTPTVVAIPTKHRIEFKASLSLIQQSAHQLVRLADEQLWRTILIPQLGCGLGGLKWHIVQPVLNEILDDRFVAVDYERK